MQIRIVLTLAAFSLSGSKAQFHSIRLRVIRSGLWVKISRAKLDHMIIPMKMLWFRTRFLICIGVATWLSVYGLSQPVEASSSSDELSAFIDEFLEFRAEDNLSDLSQSWFHSQLEQTQDQLRQLRSIDRDALNPEEQIDWRFAESILRGEEIEQADIRAWVRDPRVYMQFRRIGRAIGRPGDPDDKAEELIEVLEILPAQLRNGRKNLSEYVPRFQELSIFMANGGLKMLSTDVPEFASANPDYEDRLRTLEREAASELQVFIRFLEDALPDKPHGNWQIGEETYTAIIKEQYLLDYDAAELYEFAWKSFNRTVEELEQLAAKIDPDKTWQELAVETKNDYPAPDEMIEAHQLWVDKARQHILENNLVPIPWAERVEVVPRAEYLRKYSYYGSFASAREKNANGVWVSHWNINPFEDHWDEKTKQEYLVEHDYGVIIVTAPHETYAGHHIQGLYQIHNPRKLRRSQGIPIFSEGWGLYNEQLMRETGFYPNDLIVLRQLQLRLWRNARVVWDVGIHTGRMSYEEAIALLSDQVGFLRWAAQLEIDGSAQYPVYRIGYFLGMSEILKMRDEYKAQMGDAFTLSDFHKALLEVGNMPLVLMREGLMSNTPTQQ